MNVLTLPIFHDDDAARSHFESVRWPNGPYCAHCGSFNVHRLQGAAHRPGLLYRRDCSSQFSATVGTVFERSHVPIHKWLLATFLMSSSKQGIFAAQLGRMLEVTYKTAWVMAHRIREAMADPNPTPLGGEGKIVEADETYYGKRETPIASDAHKGRPYLKRDLSKQKRPVVALVERGGSVRAMHMRHVTGANVREALIRNADRKRRLHTDESPLYTIVGTELAQHETIKHTIGEYARGDVTTNTVEGFFGLFKRGMRGIYQHCGEQHLDRYPTEFAFRWNNRIKLGIGDAERANRILAGAEGKRLTYRRLDAA